MWSTQAFGGIKMSITIQRRKKNVIFNAYHAATVASVVVVVKANAVLCGTLKNVNCCSMTVAKNN